MADARHSAGADRTLEPEASHRSNQMRRSMAPRRLVRTSFLQALHLSGSPGVNRGGRTDAGPRGRSWRSHHGRAWRASRLAIDRPRSFRRRTSEGPAPAGRIDRPASAISRRAPRLRRNHRHHRCERGQRDRAATRQRTAHRRSPEPPSEQQEWAAGEPHPGTVSGWSRPWAPYKLECNVGVYLACTAQAAMNSSLGTRKLISPLSPPPNRWTSPVWTTMYGTMMRHSTARIPEIDR